MMNEDIDRENSYIKLNEIITELATQLNRFFHGEVRRDVAVAIEGTRDLLHRLSLVLTPSACEQIPLKIVHELYGLLDQANGYYKAALGSLVEWDRDRVDDLFIRINKVCIHVFAACGAEYPNRNDSRKYISRELARAKELLNRKAERVLAKTQLRSDFLRKSFEEFDQQKQRIDKILSDQQSKFSDLMNEHRKEFSLAMQAKIEKANSTIAEKEKELSEQIGDISASFVERLQVLEKRLEGYGEHAKELLGIIADDATTGHFLKHADKERGAANRYRWASISFMVLMAVSAGVIVALSFYDNQANWHMAALFRLALASVFIPPAVYCGVESSKHRKNEQKSRRMQLELAAIGPYLQQLDDSVEAQKIITQLAHQYFGDKSINNGQEDEFHKLKNIKTKDLLKVMKEFGKVARAVNPVKD